MRTKGTEMERKIAKPWGKYFPLELIAGVLSRLPVDSLMRFRCVSKVLRSLIESPDSCRCTPPITPKIPSITAFIPILLSSLGKMPPDLYRTTLNCIVLHRSDNFQENHENNPRFRIQMGWRSC